MEFAPLATVMKKPIKRWLGVSRILVAIQTNIYLILWMKYKIMQQTGCGITTMKDHTKQTKEGHL
jgi:hypothetical protein